MASIWDQFQPYQAPAAAPTGPGNGGGQGDDGVTPLTGEDYLKTLDPGRANMIRAYVQGRSIPVGNARSPQVQSVRTQAAEAFPDFDETLFKSRQATRQDFSSGQSAKNITSLGTTMGHLDELVDAQKRLAQHDYPWVNWAQNGLVNASGGGGPKDYGVAKQAVADELARVFRGAGMSEAEADRWLSTLDPSMSPEQFHDVVGRGIKLLRSRMNEMANQYNRGMHIGSAGLEHEKIDAADDEGRRVQLQVGPQGLTADDLLSPQAREHVAHINDWLHPNLAAARQHGAQAGPASGPQIPANAIAALRGNPQLAAQFDAKYGAGVAAKLLGGP